MAIVKLQNGNVLLKDGKVSCSCCAPPPICCLYPVQAFLNLYSYDDLPDQVVAGGAVLSKVDGGGEFGIYYTDGANEIQFATLWLLSGPITNYKTFESSCLIEEYIYIPFDEFDPALPPIPVEDQFADSYAINGVVGGWGNDFGFGVSGYVVSRIDLCTWTGSYDLVYVSNSTSTESGTSQIKLTLFYSIEESISEPYWGISFDYKDWNVTDNLTGQPVPEPGSTFTKKKIPIPGFGISSPAGDYYAGEGTGQWIVS